MMKYWPRIQDVAELSEVSKATVDRVMHERPGVSRKTKKRVFDAVEELQRRGMTPNQIKYTNLHLNFSFIIQSGPVFAERISKEIDKVFPKFSKYGVSISKSFMTGLDLQKIEDEIIRTGSDCDGVVVICQEDTFISNAIKKLVKQDVQVVSISNDIPDAPILGCVKMDQLKAGYTAGTLLGRFIGKSKGDVAVMVSGKFRCQQEREMGFRQTLRDKFPLLNITEIIHTQDNNESSYKMMRDYFQAGNRPLGIYNTTGGIKGVADAISEFTEPGNQIVYICHELTDIAKDLLLRGKIDAVIDHDAEIEITLALKHLINFRIPRTFDVNFDPLPIRIYLPENTF